MHHLSMPYVIHMIKVEHLVFILKKMNPTALVTGFKRFHKGRTAATNGRTTAEVETQHLQLFSSQPQPQHKPQTPPNPDSH